jgi:predicted MFS family arabinose efflux permease
MEAYGWRVTMGYMSMGVLLIALPAWLIAIRLNRDLRNTVSRTSASSTGLWDHFRVISRDRNFWLIALGIFLVSGIDQAMMHNYVLFLREDKGLDWRAISWGGSLLAVVGVLAKIGSGWVYDRLSIRGIMLFYIMLGISIFMGLPVVGVSSMIAFLVVRGVAHGGLIVDVPILTKHYFGMQHIGLTIGIMALFMQLGFAVGPPILGRMADSTGNYTTGFLAYGSLAIVAALTLVTVKPRYWTPPNERPAASADTIAEKA